MDYCNKCGFTGEADRDGFHKRPSDGRDCNYTAYTQPDAPMTDTKPSDVEGLIAELNDLVDCGCLEGKLECATRAATTLAAQQARIEALQKIVTELAEFDARNSIVHLRDMARAALKEPTT